MKIPSFIEEILVAIGFVLMGALLVGIVYGTYILITAKFFPGDEVIELKIKDWKCTQSYKTICGGTLTRVGRTSEYECHRCMQWTLR